MKRIVELEALRGALALWVIVGHSIKHSGYLPEDLGAFGLMANPGYAVDVFIILSGFVIFGLLDSRPMTYTAFMVQRFFRLFPMFAVVLMVTAMTVSGQAEWLRDFPWQTPFLKGCLDIALASRDQLLAQIAVHLTMLHGLIPDSVLPYSQYAIVGQAWSISVEWQFYLLAPLLYFGTMRKPAAMGLVVLAIAFLRGRYWLGEGFAVNQAAFFLVGIVSYFLFKHLPRLGPLDARVLTAAALIAAAFVYLIVPQPVSLMLWIAVLWVVAAAHYCPRDLPLKVAAWARTPAAQWIGRISYSIYLVHFLVLYGVSTGLLVLFPEMPKAAMCALLMLLTLIGTIAVSSLTFMLIEAPAMAFGHRLADILNRKRTVLGEPRRQPG